MSTFDYTSTEGGYAVRLGDTNLGFVHRSFDSAYGWTACLPDGRTLGAGEFRSRGEAAQALADWTAVTAASTSRNFRIDDALYAAAQAEAANQGIAVSDVVRDALRQFVEGEQGATLTITSQGNRAYLLPEGDRLVVLSTGARRYESPKGTVAVVSSIFPGGDVTKVGIDVCERES
jgi:hypothetical protein